MQMAAICGTDVHAWHLDATPAPMIFGHENVGVIAEIAPEISTDVLGQPLRPGDRVIFRDAPCGRCFRCAVGESCQNTRSYGTTLCNEAPYLRGGFGQYIQLSATPWLLRVPDDVSNDRALLSVIGNHTALNGIDRIGGINLGDTVVVQGSGPIGMGALNQSLLGGAGRVIVVGRTGEQARTSEHPRRKRDRGHHGVQHARGARRARDGTHRRPRRRCHHRGVRRADGVPRRLGDGALRRTLPRDRSVDGLRPALGQSRRC